MNNKRECKDCGTKWTLRNPDVEARMCPNCRSENFAPPGDVEKRVAKEIRDEMVRRACEDKWRLASDDECSHFAGHFSDWINERYNLCK